ncbi:hypothetical protein N665_0681s0007 [Sinapis alba]|nr:hypothetical protein N665_0681s0007 [Sinapis alba]
MHPEDQEKTSFMTKYIKKLNPTKCSFGVCSEKFIRYIVTHRGIKANPEKIRAIQTIPLPRNVKEVQKLTVLVREEGKNAETRYSHLEKIDLALVVADRKFQPYFQAHQIVISSHLAKWAVELGEYNVVFKLATTIKFQVLVDFVAEFSPAMLPALEKEINIRNEKGETGEWTLHTASRAIRCNFKATNYGSEYEALISGLTLAKQMEPEDIQVLSDLQLIINQVKREYQAKDANMVKYLSIPKHLIKKFKRCNLTQIPREQNSQADALANLGSSLETKSLMSIPFRVLHFPATKKEEEPARISAIEKEITWMTPIVKYLGNDILLADRNKSRRIKKQGARYYISRGRLYIRSFAGPYLQCITPKQAKMILAVLHDGECKSHSNASFTSASPEKDMGHDTTKTRKHPTVIRNRG